MTLWYFCVYCDRGLKSRSASISTAISQYLKQKIQCARLNIESRKKNAMHSKTKNKVFFHEVSSDHALAAAFARIAIIFETKRSPVSKIRNLYLLPFNILIRSST